MKRYIPEISKGIIPRIFFRNSLRDYFRISWLDRFWNSYEDSCRNFARDFLRNFRDFFVNSKIFPWSLPFFFNCSVIPSEFIPKVPPRILREIQRYLQKLFKIFHQGFFFKYSSRNCTKTERTSDGISKENHEELFEAIPWEILNVDTFEDF